MSVLDFRSHFEMALYDIDSDCDDFIEHEEKSRNWRLCELLARANYLLGLNVLSNDI